MDFWRVRSSLTYFRTDEDISVSTVNPRPSEGILFSSSLRVSDHFSLLYAQQRDIENDRNARLAIGVQYDDDCSFLRVYYETSDNFDRGVGNAESIKIAIGLRTLGQLSDNTFD